VLVKKELREQVYQKYGGRCAYCGQEITIRRMQVDHVIPKRHYSEQHGCLIVKCRLFTEYGLNDIQNLNPACHSCNNRKSTHPLEEFREEIVAQLSRLRRDSNPFRLAERFGQVKETGEPVVFWFERYNATNTSCL
jgi:hypothetical protein